MTERIDELIEQRNTIQIRAENVSDGIAIRAWERLGVASRHIERILDGILPLSPGVEQEILRSFRHAEELLPAKGDTK